MNANNFEKEILKYQKDFQDKKIAICHYWFVSWRGGEKVVESLLKLFPQADVYTLFYDEIKYKKKLKNQKVYTSILNKPFLRNHYQKLFPLYSLGVKSLQFKKKYDLILSSESGPIKGINKAPYNEKTPHICYIHTPMRYCWGYRQEYLNRLPQHFSFLSTIIDRAFESLKNWDKTTINNVDFYISNSDNIAKRVKKYYQKESLPIYPPIHLKFFNTPLGQVPLEKKDYYLSFGALVPYKNIELLIKTFKKNKKKLIVIGEGSERNKLEKIANIVLNQTIFFLGELPMDKIINYIHNAKALLFPGEEDFGMIPLEVMSQGIPVIAYAKGGALETVNEDSGVFFKANTSDSLLKAIEEFEKKEKSFSAEKIRLHARNFGEDIFIAKMHDRILNFFKSSNN